MMNWFKLSALLVLLFTAPFLLFTVKAASEYYEQSLRLKTTEGTIVSDRTIYREGRFDDNDRWQPGYYQKIYLIEFATDQGRNIQFESSNLVGERNPEIGNKVEVIYDPSPSSEDPEASINVPGWSRWGITVFLILLNAAIVTVPAVLFLIGKYVDRRRRQRFVG